MSLNFCDLLVLGSDLSGLMTATLLAKRGMSVLVLDDETENEPSPNFASGLGSRAFKSLLGKLMIPDSKLQILHENKVSGQIVFPRNRLDLHASRPLLLKEIEREFSADREAFEELMAEIDRLRENYLEEILSFFPIVGARERKRFIKWFRNFPQEKTVALWDRLSPTFKECLRVHMRFLSQGPMMEPVILQLLFFLPPESGATFSVRGGPRGLKKLFFDKLDYFGGMVHPLGHETFEVVTKGREIRAIQLPRYNFPTRCRYLLGNTDIKTLYRCLPSPFFSFFPFLGGPSKRKIESLETAHEKRVIQYHLSREILPAPLKENVLCVGDPSQPLEGSNYLEINLHPLAMASKNGKDTLMTVSCHLREKEGADLLDEIDRKIHRLLPFANSHIERVFPPAASAEGESGGDMELFPEEGNGLQAGQVERLPQRKVSYLSSFFFPSLDSPFKNLFVLGPNLLDWLGMEGKMLAALRAVDLVWSRELKIRKG